LHFLGNQYVILKDKEHPLTFGQFRTVLQSPGPLVIRHGDFYLKAAAPKADLIGGWSVPGTPCEKKYH